VTDIFLKHYIESFEDRLKDGNYKAGTIKIYRVLIHRLAMIMDERCVRPEDLTVELAAELVRGEERKTLEPHKCANIARRFTEYIIGIGVATATPPTPKQIAREKLRHNYEDYLRRQRGLSDRSIYHCWRLADRFLDHRFGDRDDDLRRISSASIARPLRHRAARSRASGSVRMCCGTVPPWNCFTTASISRSSRSGLDMSPWKPRRSTSTPTCD
jgi:hypothetical protein